MLSFVLTSVSAAKDYTPFARSTPVDFFENDPGPSDLSTSVRKRYPSSSSSSSPAPFPPNPFSQELHQQRQKDPLSRPSQKTTSDDEKYAVIHDILRCHDLYAVLDVPKTCDANGLRRGYMKRCKACHPDKYPSYPLATVAFQKVSFAYDTLSTPSSRRLYDAHGLPSVQLDGSDPDGFTHPSYTARADETLSAVLVGVFCDFMEGDFQMLRTFLRAMNDVNPAMNIHDDTIESLVGTFARLREILLTGQKYVRVVRYELMRLYEIQHSLRQLSYFDVCGRLKLTLQLARVTLSLPCAIDRVIAEEEEQEERDERRRKGASASSDTGVEGKEDARGVTDSDADLNGGLGGHERHRRKRRRLLHPRVNSVLVSVCGLLEYGERVL